MDTAISVGDIFTHTQAIRAAVRSDELVSAVRKLAVHFGYFSMLFAWEDVSDKRRRPVLLPVALPATFAGHFVSMQHETNFPVWRDLRSRMQTVAWSRDDLALQQNARAAAVLEDLRGFGIESGLSLPVLDETGLTGSVTYFCDGPDLPEADHSTLHLLGLFAHKLLGSLVHAEAPQTTLLTRREAEVLRWTAMGKTSNEIGSILEWSALDYR